MNRRTGVILSYFALIIDILSTLFLTPYIISTLGQAEYGVYKLSAAVVSYLLLLDLGVGNAVVRYIAKYRTEKKLEQSKKFLGISTIYYGIIGVLAVLIGVLLVCVFPYCFSKGLRDTEIILGQKLLIITSLTSAVTLGTSSFSNTITAYERFDIVKGFSIIQVVLKIGFIFLALKLGYGSIGIAFVNLILTIICRTIYVLFVLFKLNIKPKFKGMEFKYIKEVVIYSSFILIQMIATQVNSFADEIMIGALVVDSASIIAIYSIGHQLTSYFQSIGTIFTGVLMPGVVKMVENTQDPKTIQDEMVRVGRIIFMTLSLIWVGFLICGKEFVKLWAGEVYIEGYYVGLILMFSYILILTESIGTQVLWAMNEHKEQSILKIIIVCVNVGLTALLIFWKPLIGATLGTTISLLLGDIVVMNIIFVKKIKIKLTTYYRELFKGIVPSLLISLIIGFLFSLIGLNGWIGLILNLLVIVLIYCLCMLLFGFKPNEKQMIFGLLKINSKKGNNNE